LRNSCRKDSRDDTHHGAQTANPNNSLHPKQNITGMLYPQKYFFQKPIICRWSVWSTVIIKKGDDAVVACSDCQDTSDNMLKFVLLGPHDDVYGLWNNDNKAGLKPKPLFYGLNVRFEQKISSFLAHCLQFKPVMPVRHQPQGFHRPLPGRHAP